MAALVAVLVLLPATREDPPIDALAQESTGPLAVERVPALDRGTRGELRVSVAVVPEAQAISPRLPDIERCVRSLAAEIRDPVFDRAAWESHARAIAGSSAKSGVARDPATSIDAELCSLAATAREQDARVASLELLRIVRERVSSGVELAPAAIAELQAICLDHDADPPLATAAVRAFSAFGGDLASAFLIGLLSSPESSDRAHELAREGLAVARGDETADGLASIASRSADRRAKELALIALGDLAGSGIGHAARAKATEVARSLLLDPETSPGLAKRAVALLGRIEDSDAAEVLAATLRDPRRSEELARAAALALSTSPDPRAPAWLDEVLLDPSSTPARREGAARARLALDPRDERAANELGELARNGPDDTLRRRAAAALRASVEAHGRACLDESCGTEDSVSSALARRAPASPAPTR
jgi:hypothetical protein